MESSHLLSLLTYINTNAKPIIVGLLPAASGGLMEDGGTVRVTFS